MVSLSGQRLVLPFPLSVNQYYRSVPIGRFVQVKISKDGRQYRKAVEAAVRDALGGTLPEPLTGRLQVTIELWQKDRRRRDIDNVLKALLDSLTHSHIWEDDSQVDDLRVTRLGIDRDWPRAEVCICEI